MFLIKRVMGENIQSLWIKGGERRGANLAVFFCLVSPKGGFSGSVRHWGIFFCIFFFWGLLCSSPCVSLCFVCRGVLVNYVVLVDRFLVS